MEFKTFDVSEHFDKTTSTQLFRKLGEKPV